MGSRSRDAVWNWGKQQEQMGASPGGGELASLGAVGAGGNWRSAMAKRPLEAMTKRPRPAIALGMESLRKIYQWGQ